MVTNLKWAVVPEDLIGMVLHLGHNQSGYNGYQRTYAAIKHVCYVENFSFRGLSCVSVNSFPFIRNLYHTQIIRN